MKFDTIIGCVIATLASVPALAAESNWYIGASAGPSSSNVSEQQLINFNKNNLPSMPQQNFSSTLDADDTSWSIFAGYQASKYFFAEVGYMEVGSVHYETQGQYPSNGPFGPYVASTWSALELESAGFLLKGTARWPLGEKFDIHADFGVLFGETKLLATGAFGAFRTSDYRYEGSTHTQSLFYGAGLGYRIGERWRISLDWQLYPDMGIDHEDLDDGVYYSPFAQDLQLDYSALSLAVSFGF